MEWVSMAEELHRRLTSPSAMQSIECCGVKRHHWTLEQWRHFFWSDESRFSGNPMDESGFGGCQENSTYLTAFRQV
ncbi:hypothetical protein AOLI_G00167780 [Acnodon oligacanthus]